MKNKTNTSNKIVKALQLELPRHYSKEFAHHTNAALILHKKKIFMYVLILERTYETKNLYDISYNINAVSNGRPWNIWWNMNLYLGA